MKISKFSLDTSEIIRGSSSALMIKIIAAPSAYAMHVLISRNLDLSSAGVFFLCLSILSITAVLCRLGFDQTLVRFVSSLNKLNKWDEINNIYFKTNLITILTSLFVALSLYLLADDIFNLIFKKPAGSKIFKTLVWAIPIISISSLNARSLQGIKKIKHSMFLLSACLPLSFILIITTAPSAKPSTIAIYYLLSATVTALAGMFFWLSTHQSSIFNRKKESVDVFGSARPLFFATVSQQVMMWAPQIFLGLWATSSSVAFYNSAQRTAMLVSFILIAVNSISAPKFSEIYQDNDIERLRKMATSTTNLLFLLSIIPLLILLFFPNYLLEIFGVEYTQASNALRILAVGQFINVSTGSVSFLLTMTGNEKALRNNTFTAAITCVILSFFLIPQYQIIGAALAAAISVSTLNILSVWQVQKKLGFNVLINKPVNQS